MRQSGSKKSILVILSLAYGMSCLSGCAAFRGSHRVGKGNQELPKTPDYLVIHRVVRNVKIYFDFDKADLRNDALPVIDEAVAVLQKDRQVMLLLTGNADARGSEPYNQQLAALRAQTVKEAMVKRGIPASRVKTVSRGKLDAVADPTDILGLQKDRNVHFVLAEAEVMKLSETQKAQYPEAMVIEEFKDQETEVAVRVEPYVIRQGDTLWKIAEQKLGDGSQWYRLAEFNRGKIKDPSNLKPGDTIDIPIE